MKCKSIEQNDFSFRKQQIKQHCEYGLEYFCDGTPNFSEVRRDAVKKPPSHPARGGWIEMPIY